MRSASTKLSVKVLALALAASACGKKKDFDRGTELEPAVLGGGGASRTQGMQQTILQPGTTASTAVVTVIKAKKTVTVKKQVTSRRLKPKPVFTIVPVTMIVPALSGLPDYALADQPFTGPQATIGTPVADGSTPFRFEFDYPPNNFQFTEAHVVIDTKRDTSGTEGIFVDGVFTGNPPLAQLRAGSPKITHALYAGSGAATTNTYYIDWSLAHYKIAAQNTFDLNMVDLLAGTDVKPKDQLADGRLDVITGDDSPIFQASLVVKGLTIAGEALSCSRSPDFSFVNDYVHNDGHTGDTAAFAGTIGTPFSGWTAGTGHFAAVEWSYDAALPQVKLENITFTDARLVLAVKRAPAGSAALVVNGVGVSEPGFDRATATAAVESWDAAGSAAFTGAVAAVTADNSQQAVTFDLFAYFGAAKVKSLLAQGKLNVALAGSMVAYGSKATSGRANGSPADGPELLMGGTYVTDVCTVPNNPDSPLKETGFVPPPDEYEDVVEEVDEQVVVDDDTEVQTEVASPVADSTVTVVDDGQGPVLSSVQAAEITSTAATVYWLTDEAATGQVLYGIGSPTGATAPDAGLTTFHQVRLTGLSPYKYYNFQVVSADKYGNESRSAVAVFATLR